MKRASYVNEKKYSSRLGELLEAVEKHDIYGVHKIFDAIDSGQFKIEESDLSWLLEIAAIHDHLDFVKIFFKRYRDSDSIDRRCNGAFELAAQCGNLDIVNFFIAHEFDGVYKLNDSSKVYALSSAAQRGHGAVVNKLIKKFDYKRDEIAEYVLSRAVENKRWFIMKLLSSVCETKGTKNQNYHIRSALEIAAEQGEFDTVKFLCESFEISENGISEACARASKNNHKAIAHYLENLKK